MENKEQIVKLGNEFLSELLKVDAEKLSIAEINTAILDKGIDNIIPLFKESGVVPIGPVSVKYEDDVWDLRDLLVIPSTIGYIHFDKVPENFVDNVKDFFISSILVKNIKLSSLKSKMQSLLPALRYFEKNGVYSISNITYTDCKNYLIGRRKDVKTLAKSKNALLEFIKFSDLNYNTKILTNEINKLLEYKPAYGSKEKEYYAFYPLPDEFLTKIIKILINVMRDEKALPDKRAKAAIIIMDSQLGLRSGELSLLKAGCVKTFKQNDVEVRSLTYSTYKTATCDGDTFTGETFCNDLCYEAYNLLMELCKEERESRGVDNLLVLQKSKCPIISTNYNSWLKSFCLDHIEELELTNKKYENVMPTKTKPARIKIKRKFSVPNDTTIYLPIMHQFRHTAIQNLLDKGVEPEFVRQFMNHLSVETTLRHASLYGTKLQENVEESDKAIRAYLSGDGKILGTQAKQLMERIDEFIAENGFNVKYDMEQIIDELLKRIPIRAKSGGYCIKGSNIVDACDLDSKTDEFMCAYGVCPNVCHYYFNVDSSYADFLSLRKSYEFNFENNYSRQAEKEKNKLNYLINNRLKPEIEELEREIEKRGIKEIVEMHPNIENIIYNLPQIKEEIKCK